MRVPRVFRRPRVRRPIAVTLAVAAILVTIAKLATPFVIEHTSMQPSFVPGELVLVEATDPPLPALARGDVIVFHPPVATYEGPPFIKRVIGLPGETVAIRDGAVFVDGRRLAEPYADGATQVGRQDPSTWTIPIGSVFVLGDNRENSWDSRGYGPVPTSEVVGRVWLAYRPATSVSLLAAAPPATWLWEGLTDLRGVPDR